MENDTGDGARGAAAEALEEMSADRRRLARRVRAPRALMASFGALGAWWVGSAAATTPGSAYEPPASGWLALLGVLVVTYLLRRETGVRFRSLGVRANWAIFAILAACLALFSVSLGLVSLGLRWAVAATSGAAFAITMWLAGVAYRSAVERIRHG